MSLKLTKTIKTSLIAVAVVSLLALGIALISKYFSKSDQDPGTVMLAQALEGTATRLGAVVRYVDTDHGQTSIQYSLVQMVQSKEFDNAKQQILVFNVQKLRPEVSAKLEKKEIDADELARVGTREMLVDESDTTRKVAVMLRKKEKGNWVNFARQSVTLDGPAQIDASHVSFLALSEKSPSLSVATADTTHYFAVINNDIKKVFSLASSFDDLQACLNFEEEIRLGQQEREAQKRKQEDANSEDDPEDDQQGDPQDDSGEFDISEQTDYACAKAKFTLKVLNSGTKGFKDLEVIAKGEGVSRKTVTQRYVLQYMPRYKAYGFGEWADHSIRDDVVNDFVSSTVPKSQP
jgi:hypothetical protein